MRYAEIIAEAKPLTPEQARKRAARRAAAQARIAELTKISDAKMKTARARLARLT